MKKLRVVMADPAGNRTAIVRTPVPAAERPQIASLLLEREDLRAEQVGFESVPVMGGEGRLEMMGGEFCGNAARSYGYMLWCERQGAFREKAAGEKTIPFKAAPGSFPYEALSEDLPEETFSGRTSSGSLLIEISGSPKPLEVVCDSYEGKAFAEMPMPVRLEYSTEGYPLVVSEGITHIILENADPQEKLANQLVDRYGNIADALGIMFLKDDCLTPFVYVAETGSRVWESSCGSGSLAAAWYLDHAADRAARDHETVSTGKVHGTAPAEEECRNASAGRECGTTPAEEDHETVSAGGDQETAAAGGKKSYLFLEPGGELIVEIRHTKDGDIRGRMGGSIVLEAELDVELNVELNAELNAEL